MIHLQFIEYHVTRLLQITITISTLFELALHKYYIERRWNKRAKIKIACLILPHFNGAINVAADIFYFLHSTP